MLGNVPDVAQEKRVLIHFREKERYSFNPQGYKLYMPSPLQRTIAYHQQIIRENSNISLLIRPRVVSHTHTYDTIYIHEHLSEI